MADRAEFADISILPRSLGLVTEEALVERRELLIAGSAERLIGIFADEAESVTNWKQPTPLPRAPASVIGVLSVRGRMATVLDPLMLLGERRGADQAAQFGFIITLRGEEQLALAVERVESIIEIKADEVEPFGPASNMVRGLVQTGGELVAVLNLQELFPAALKGAERRRRRGGKNRDEG
jgi:purine-binding chemotaxis protein CheW